MKAKIEKMVPHKVPVSVHGMINSENVHEDIFKTQMKLYKGKSYSDLCCSDKRVTIAAALIIIILDKRKREKQRKRKKILKKKKHPAKVFQKSKAVNDIPTVCPSVFMHQNPVTAEPPNLQKELSLQDAEMYRQYLKIDTNSFYKLFDLIKPLVQRKNTVMRECISTTERLAITLRYLALGETQKALAKEFRIAQNTISGIIPEVCQALCAVFEKALTLPSSAEGWRSVAHAFGRSWGFPWCLGALDGKVLKMSHAKTDSPQKKSERSVCLVTLVSADCTFLFGSLCVCGPLQEEEEWEESPLGTLLEGQALCLPPPEPSVGGHPGLPFVLVSSEAFPLRRYLMKPFPSEFVDAPRRVFNHRVSRAHRASDNAFGLLLHRFQVLRQPLRTSLAKGRPLVRATLGLHNFLMGGSSRLAYCPAGMTDVEDLESGMFYPGQWREGGGGGGGFSPLPCAPEAIPVHAEDVRRAFCHHLYSQALTEHPS